MHALLFRLHTNAVVFSFDNILLDENSYQNIFMYYILWKTLIGVKPLRIRFDKLDGFIRIHDGTVYLVLFGPNKMHFTKKKKFLTKNFICCPVLMVVTIKLNIF